VDGTGYGVPYPQVDPTTGISSAHVLYSWNIFSQYFAENVVDLEERILYALILNSRFSYRTCKALAEAGCELFRFIYVRPFATFRTSSIVVMKSGIGTLLTAYGHAFGTVGFDADAGYVTINAEMRHGVVPVGPKNIELIPYAIFEDHEGGRNTVLITSRNEFASPAPNKPATLALPVPVTETRHAAPLLLGSQAAYPAPDSGYAELDAKASITDLFNAFVGVDLLGEISAYTSEAASYWDHAQMATVCHRECTWYYNPTSNKWHAFEGTGPLRDIGQNIPAAAEVYHGVGVFPTNYETTLLVL